MKSVKLIKQTMLLMLITLITSTMLMAEKPPRKNRYGKTWKHLGSKSINGKIDEDRIHVGRWAGKLDAIQLRTNDDRIDLERAVIHFSNGERQVVNLRDDWRGEESHIINLKGSARYVSHIVYVGVKKNRHRHRRNEQVEHDREVEVWGLKASNGNKYKRKKQSRDRYGDYERYDDEYDRDYDDRYDRRNENRDRDQRRRNNPSCGN